MPVRTVSEPIAKWVNVGLPRVALFGCLMAGAAYPAFGQTVWTGASDDDWFNAGNWDTSAVPDAATSVEVNSGTAVISGNSAEGENVSIGSGGSVTVTGPGASLTTTETRTDGGTSGGVLNIENGGLVTNSNGVVAGTAIVSGTDGSGNASTWTNNDYFAVGDGASGTLKVLAGGKVVVNTDAVLGQSDHGDALPTKAPRK